MCGRTAACSGMSYLWMNQLPTSPPPSCRQLLPRKSEMVRVSAG